MSKLSKTQVLAQLARLESLMVDMEALTRNIDRSDRDNMRLSLIEAKEHLAKARGWLADEIVCLKVDNEIPFGSAQEGNTDVA